MEYGQLFDKNDIGSLTIKNRFIMAPMGNNFGISAEAVSQRQIDYYERRAKGGVGLIVTESCPVELLGRHGNNRIQVYLENSASALSRLTSAVHQYDAKIALQLTHGGSKCAPELIGEYPVAPSSLPIPKKDYFPRSLTRQEIAGIITQFASAARVALQADFDAIQLLAASGHLIHQFISPVSNRRTDEYGGSLQNRIRFLLEIVESIRSTTQGRLPIMAKLYGKDPENPEGTRIMETEIPEIAAALYQSGIASVHLSTNYSADPARDRRDLLELTQQIRKSTPVTIAVAGSIFHPREAARILAQYPVDLIELGRPLLAEPDFVHKAFEKKDDDLRPCLNCNHCRYATAKKQAIKCTINPFLGKEATPPGNRGDKSKRIAIIGGGPAGLQAAIQLSKLGHRGVIYEKEMKLGGMLWAAATAPSKERMKTYLAYLLHQVGNTNFEIKTDQAITLSNIDELLSQSWDAVIIAVGAKPYLPKLKMPAESQVLFAGEVLAEKRSIKGPVVILGAGQVGCEVANFLSENNATKVTLMATGPKIAANVIPQERSPMLKQLGEKGVRVLVNAFAIEYDGAMLQFQHNHMIKMIGCEALIIAKGWEPSAQLKTNFEAKFGNPVFLIGDAATPGSLLEALEAGVAVATTIDSIP